MTWREKSAIDKSANVSDNISVKGPVKIGKNVIIHEFVTLYPMVTLEDNVEVYEGAVIGRPPNGAGALSRKVTQEIRATRIGKGSVISCNSVIYTDVEIGEGTLVGDGACIREKCRIGDECIIAMGVTVNYNTTIGHHTKVMDNTHITGNMKIGNHVFIGMLVSTANDNTIGSAEYKEELDVGPTIEDNVMIGTGAIILPGLVIGHDAIIGAGAVVTKNVPAKKVAMGVPARLIRDV